MIEDGGPETEVKLAGLGTWQAIDTEGDASPAREGDMGRSPSPSGFQQTDPGPVSRGESDSHGGATRTPC